MQPNDPTFHKPKSFIAAKNLLYASIFLSVINFVIHSIRFQLPVSVAVLGWCIAAAGFILMIFFIKQMGLCKKWARTVLVVWFAIVFVMMIISLVNGRANFSIPEIAIWVIKTLLEIIAIIYLYGKDCENWFNSKKYEMFQK